MLTPLFACRGGPVVRERFDFLFRRACLYGKRIFRTLLLLALKTSSPASRLHVSLPPSRQFMMGVPPVLFAVVME